MKRKRMKQRSEEERKETEVIMEERKGRNKRKE